MPYPEGGYNDLDHGLNPTLQDHYRITPSPGGPGEQYGTVFAMTFFVFRFFCSFLFFSSLSFCYHFSSDCPCAEKKYNVLYTLFSNNF